MKKTTTTLMLCIILFSACVKNNLKKDMSIDEQLSEPLPTTCYYPSVTVSTSAGSGIFGYLNGSVKTAQFLRPYAMAAFGSIQYIGDEYRIRKISGATVSTFYPGSTVPGNVVNALATDVDGNVYAAFSNHFIRKISPSGTVLATWGDYSGYSDVPPFQFTHVGALAVDIEGNIYIADRGNFAIRKISTDGTISTIAGGPSNEGFLDGPAANAKFSSEITGIAVSPLGDRVYVADFTRVRLITGGNVYTIAGGISGYADGNGLSARFTLLGRMAIDASENLYVTDHIYSGSVTYHFYIRKIIKMTTGLIPWKVTTLAGNGYGYLNGDGSVAKFYNPGGIVINPEGTNVYVADRSNYRIRKLTLACGITF